MLYILSSTKLLLLTVAESLTLSCTVQGLKYALMASTIGCQSRELIGLLSVTFGGAPNYNIAGSLDSAYLGPSGHHNAF